MTTINWQSIQDSLSAKLNLQFKFEGHREVQGGCINRAFVVDGQRESLFIKLNARSMLTMFEAEAKALEEIAETNSVRVPAVIGCGESESLAYLALEKLDLERGRRAEQKTLGEELAKLHLSTQAKFGWQWDNAIGSTPQCNHQSNDWVQFWKTQRLGFQLDLAAKNGYSSSLQERGAELLGNLHNLFLGYRPSPSLLHGDLWSGNTAITRAGENVIFDPASYYGDRECDLAMTELFGGFDREFYAAYASILPHDEGYAVRKRIYNLYHILNHLNLFGSGYLQQAESTIEGLLRELG
ncbi:fructosamine kinase family protein [Pseudomonadota bacterium]